MKIEQGGTQLASTVAPGGQKALKYPLSAVSSLI